MKRFFILLIAVLLLVNVSHLGAEEAPAGIILGDSVISPGQKIVFVFSNLGFPENMYAMRGKKDQKDDYVKFDYIDYGLTLDITSGENEIKAIYVRKREQKLKGIPFNVGDPYDHVKKAWGEPDKKEQNYANYFYKGVTLTVSDEGRIELIIIFKPGTIDYDEMKKGKTS